MIRVLLDQYYSCLPAPPPLGKSGNLCIQQNAGQTTFGTEKAEMGLAKGLRGEGGGRGVCTPFLPQGYFIFGSDVKLCI